MSYKRLSTLIFQIYSAARSGGVLEYQRSAIESLKRHIPFDCAWWGRGHVSGDEHRVFASFAYELPQDSAERLNSSDRGNVVAKRVVAEPGRAHYFDYAALHSQPSTAALSDYMDVAQAICIAESSPVMGISNFISLARRKTSPVFSRSHQSMLELISPHLAAALDMALAEQLAALRNPSKCAVIASDSLGSLRVAEPAALDLLRQEWPAWTGPLLPEPLRARIAQRQSSLLGRHISATLQWHASHVFVSLRGRDARDLLTKQERAVASAFASGRSYREVAEHLGIAPTTVRHHLRAVYVKLGVSDKAAFATRLGAQTDDTFIA